MKKSTKGALAAGGAAALLLGGAGSLAYWTEVESVPGGAIESGHLEITGDTCAAAPFMLDGDAPFTGATRIVPGDTITKTCEFVIDGEGDHFDNVTLGIAAVSWSGSNELTTALGTPSAIFEDSAGVVENGDTVAVGETITATISMTFPTTVTGDVAEDDVATLNAVTVTATQNHTP